MGTCDRDDALQRKEKKKEKCSNNCGGYTKKGTTGESSSRSVAINHKEGQQTKLNKVQDSPKEKGGDEEKHGVRGIITTFN